MRLTILLEKPRNGIRVTCQLALEGDRILLGRATTLLGIRDPKTSRFHAVIYSAGSEIFINDLSSKHGTFVNEKTIKQESLKKGDRIRIGSITLEILEFDTREFEFIGSEDHSLFEAGRKILRRAVGTLQELTAA